MNADLMGIETIFRPFELADAEPLREYLNHPVLIGRRYLPREFPEEIPISPSMMEALIEQWSKTENRVHLAIVHRISRNLIGHASAYWGWDPHCPGVELVISPEYHRKGFGSDAFRLLVQWIFDSLPAHNIGVEVASWNEPAHDFLFKQGFQESGRSRREGMRKGKFYDLVLFDILRREWKGRE